MGKHQLDTRKYGCRYQETRDVADLAELAERILADMSPAGTENIPTDAKFSIHVIAGVLLRLHVGGLADSFTFADWATRRYSDQATTLIDQLASFMESYNWADPGDPTDRRFVCSVYLLAESDFRSTYWTPGVVRVAA